MPCTRSMSITLIPRVSVNYSIKDLIRSLFISENGNKYRRCCSKLLAEYFDSESVLLVPSARDAIYELLIRLPQKKVVIPAYTCIAVNEAVLLAGKEIVYSRTDRETFNSDYLECIESDTIVLATHQYGLPCNIEAIALKCNKTGAILIEDCATSMGTIVDGKKTGTFGDYAVVSFNASKLLNVPPFGGVLISKDKKMIDDIKNNADWKKTNLSYKVKGLVRGIAFVMTKNVYFYRLFHYLTIQSKGKIQKTEHEKPSDKKTDLYTYQFSEWQAVILLRQLKQLDKILAKRRELYEFYDKRIANPLVKKPLVNNDAVCCRYAIQVPNRSVFYRECIKQGVDMDFSHCSLGCPDSFKEEHEIAGRILNLPYYYHLSEKEKIKVVRVVNSIKNEQ